MPDAQVVDICRHTLLEVLLLAAPILAIAVAVSLTRERGSGADFAAGGHAVSRAAASGGRRGSVFHDAVDVAADGPIHREIVVRFSSVREIGRLMEISLTELLTGPLVIGIRISGLMLFAPFFGNNAIPPRIKAMLVIAHHGGPVSRVFRAGGYRHAGPMAGSGGAGVVLGVAIGVATNFVFEAAQMAGSMLGVQMGYSLVNILDPKPRWTRLWSPCFTRR